MKSLGVFAVTAFLVPLSAGATGLPAAVFEAIRNDKSGISEVNPEIRSGNQGRKGSYTADACGGVWHSGGGETAA
jgi:hypothetical protein